MVHDKYRLIALSLALSLFIGTIAMGLRGMLFMLGFTGAIVLMGFYDNLRLLIKDQSP